MTDAVATVRLSDRPGWRYLLRDFYETYRRGTAAGSGKIRSHQRRVREAITKIIAENPEILPSLQADKPVTAHLARALNQGKQGAMQTLVRSVEAVLPELSWQYGYDKVPKGLATKFAYAEFVGPQGPVKTDRLILGMVLFAPGCTYPAHSHDGLTESYYTLSGAVSENDAGVYAPGSMIFNPEGHRHRITTGDFEPTLLSYAWEGPRDKLANQKMVFSRAKTGMGK